MKWNKLIDCMKKKIASFCYNGEYVKLAAKTDENFQGFSIQEGNLEWIFEFQFLEKTETISWKTSVINKGDNNSKQITNLAVLDLTLPIPLDASVIHKGLKGDSVSENSFLPFETEISCGDMIRKKPYGGKSSHHAFPFFDICMKNGGLILAIGWSGTWFYSIERTESELLVKAGLPDVDFYLEPGDRVELPSILIMSYEGTYRNAHNRFRAMMKEEFSPKKRFGNQMRMPIALQNFDRYTYDMPFWNTEEGQLKEIEYGKLVKYANAYWLDAAWFEKGFPDGVGNYSFREGFPNGLTNIDKAAHENGMKALIWFEPERVACDTEVYKEHPEYLISLDTESENKNGVLFDLSNSEALGWLIETISKFIEEYEIDIYRHDFNIYPAPFWKKKDSKGRCGITEIKYIQGLYKFYDALLERFPKLMIDCCASGGNRMDLETYKRCIYCWRSDTGCYPDSETVKGSLWNQNQNLTISDYIVYHAIACWTPTAYDVRSAMANGFAANFDVFSKECDFDKITMILEEINRVGGYWEKNFYPMSKADLDETHWSLWQFGTEKAGVLQAFRRDKSEQTEEYVSFAGLDNDAQYLLKIADEHYQIDEQIVSGERLTKGYRLNLENPRSSLVIEYKKQ